MTDSPLRADPIMRTPPPAASPLAAVTERPAWVRAGMAAAIAVLLLVGSAVVGALAVLISARGATAPPAGTFTIYGVLSLTDATGVMNSDNDTCTGMGGYADIREGASVTVTNPNNAVVGTGSLKHGTPKTSGPAPSCEFAFEIPNVPAGDGSYGIEVARRGSISFAEAEVTTRDALLTLG